jgi:hypothetical protein
MGELKEENQRQGVVKIISFHLKVLLHVLHFPCHVTVLSIRNGAGTKSEEVGR